MYVWESIIIALTSFLIGSVPFGILLARAFRLPDPRTMGSGNIGATNMLRTGRKDVALLTLLLDGGKGSFAVVLAWQFAAYVGAAPDYALRFACLATFFSVFGHCYAPWLNFKGGKGVATVLGAVVALYFPLAIIVCSIWLYTFLRSRYSSLSALLALVAMPLLAFGRFEWQSAVILLFTSLLVIYRHRENIYRLRAGTEPKFGSKKDEK